MTTTVPFVIFNWKSHKLESELVGWLQQLKVAPPAVKAVLAVPFPYLPTVRELLPSGWALAAQDVSPFPMGAYTGAVNAQQLAELGVKFCIVGHSERRRYFHETTPDIQQKVSQLLDFSITPIICVDLPYLAAQAAELSNDQAKQNIIAYEPLAAIGSGHPANPEDVRQTIKKIREVQPYQAVLYGGSVDAETAFSYSEVSDGVLVGTASLDVQEVNLLIERLS